MDSTTDSQPKTIITSGSNGMGGDPGDIGRTPLENEEEWLYADIVLKGNGGKIVLTDVANKIVLISGRDMHVVLPERPKHLYVRGFHNFADMQYVRKEIEEEQKRKEGQEEMEQGEE